MQSFNLQIAETIGVNVGVKYLFEHFSYDRFGDKIMTITPMEIGPDSFMYIHRNGQIYFWIGGFKDDEETTLYCVHEDGDDIAFQRLSDAKVEMVDGKIGIFTDINEDPIALLPFNYPTIGNMQAAHDEQEQQKQAAISIAEEEKRSSKRKFEEMSDEIAQLKEQLKAAHDNIAWLKRHRVVTRIVQPLPESVEIVDLSEEA